MYPHDPSAGSHRAAAPETSQLQCRAYRVMHDAERPQHSGQDPA